MGQVKHCLALGAYINGQDQDWGTGTAKCMLRGGRVAGLDIRCEGAARSEVCSWCSKFMLCHGISIRIPRRPNTRSKCSILLRMFQYQENIEN